MKEKLPEGIKKLAMAGSALRTDSQLALGAFADRLRRKIRTLGERQMDNSSFIRAHRFKCERNAGLSHAIRGEIGHCLELGFTRRAKSVYVANQPLSRSEASTEHLIDQVLQGFK